MIQSNKKLSHAHPEQPEHDIIIEPVRIILRNNVFKFNKQVNIQKQKTAMGTRWHPHMQTSSWEDLKPHNKIYTSNSRNGTLIIHTSSHSWTRTCFIHSLCQLNRMSQIILIIDMILVLYYIIGL